ncbi:hypothetical protein SLNWT_5705 [Streptomyces albus]|uniref:Uncharacterized protein n=1 Tax=Streptomyces albus (strain ATCC 21838 / DSM 41398 / FERM P-419 / JCM 4703 / NBRC 107858) TaxID=1081613 RepID=A0A0B5F5B5_STRA4|nr:hypothetical protein SLNWT_5705 [Streptomyces albus]AOU80382.1 hypothetical protein SLNHY_5691 [Streptomyces albus]AYN36094.1 hypothetical protein DUI70_5599 [Streptomyces albus]
MGSRWRRGLTGGRGPCLVRDAFGALRRRTRPGGRSVGGGRAGVRGRRGVPAGAGPLGRVLRYPAGRRVSGILAWVGPLVPSVRFAGCRAALRYRTGIPRTRGGGTGPGALWFVRGTGRRCTFGHRPRLSPDGRAEQWRGGGIRRAGEGAGAGGGGGYASGSTGEV